MARSVTTLTIFLSSPGELDSERGIVERIVDIVNKSIRTTDIQFDLWNWKDDAMPGVGVTAQGVIDRQIPEHDVYLGLMWKCFGTPTADAGSGTEHEFRNSLSSYRDSKIPRHVIFAFKTEIDLITDINPVELIKIGEFKDDLQKEGILYTTFAGATELEKLLTISLTKIALSWSVQQPDDDSSEPTSGNSAPPTEEMSNDDELGLLDYWERAEEGMETATENISQIGDALAEMAESISERTEGMNAGKGANGQLTVKLARKLTNQAADDMVRFSKLATPMIASADESFEGAIDAITQVLTSHKSFTDEEADEGDLNEFRRSMDSLIEAVEEADEGMESMRETVLGLPKLSAKFNRSRRELLVFLDGYSRMSSRLKSLASNVIQVISSIHES